MQETDPDNMNCSVGNPVLARGYAKEQAKLAELIARVEVAEKECAELKELNQHLLLGTHAGYIHITDPVIVGLVDHTSHKPTCERSNFTSQECDCGFLQSLAAYESRRKEAGL